MGLQTLKKRVATAAIAFNVLAMPAVSFAATDSLPAVDPSYDSQIRLTKSWSVAIDPLLPLPLILALGGLYGAACLYRRQPGTIARLLAGGTIALILLNPQKLDEQREILPTEIIVAVDKTASQNIGDRDIMTESARAALMNQLNNIEGLHIRVIEIDGLGDNPSVDGTALFSELNKTLGTISRDRLGGIFVLTDGQVHDVPLPETWKGENIPVHALISGSDNERDRRIVVDNVARFGLIDSVQNIRFHVADEGQIGLGGQPVTVTLHHNGEEIDRRDVIPGEMNEIPVNISGVGHNLFELRTVVVEGELTDANNSITVNIEGIRENLNVLLLSGQPNRATRIYRDLFKSDPDTNLVHLTIMRPPEKEDATLLREMSLTPLPTREIFTEKLQEFDLVIFDNYQRRGLLPLPYFSRLDNYVKNGGSLLVISSDEYAGSRSLYKTPLSDILPVAPTGFTEKTPYLPSVSDVGRRHPVTRFLNDSTYTGRWGSLIGGSVLSGHTVMQTDTGKPLVVLDRKGQGRVAMIMSDHLWLWDKGYEGGGPSDVLLRGLSHWLLKTPAYDEEALRLNKNGQELVIERQSLGNVTAPVTITSPSGRNIAVPLDDMGAGIWRATIPVTESGIYRAAQDGETPLTAFSDIHTVPVREMADTISTSEKLAPITALTGGYNARMTNVSGTLLVPTIKAVAPTGDGAAYSGQDWAGIRIHNQTVLKGVEQSPLIPGWVMLLSLIGAVAAFCAREGDNRFLNKAMSRFFPGGNRKKEGMNAPSI